MSENELHTKNNKKKIIIILLTIVFFVCLCYIAYYLYSSIQNKNLYNSLNEPIVEQPVVEPAQESEPVISETTPTYEYVEKVKALKQEYEDVKGWIRIENTNINYPILQSNNDNDYYLSHNYKKENNRYGSISINTKCDIKKEGSNVIIYGHNMQDEQMFGDLLKYQNKSFFDEHPIITIDTDETETQYQIMYAFKSRIFYQDETNVFRFYRYYDFEDENKFNEYVTNCKKIQLYDTGITPIYGNQLITLVTCEYSQNNGRFVIVAQKIK